MIGLVARTGIFWGIDNFPEHVPPGLQIVVMPGHRVHPTFYITFGAAA
jgi:hypothetical protein